MKNKIKQYLLGILAVSALLVGLFMGTANVSANVVPSCDRATLYGTVTPDGTPTDAWFEWGTNSGMGNKTARQTFYSETQYSQTINNLTQNTTYYFRAVAESQYGMIYGETQSFQTSQCSTPAPTPKPQCSDGIDNDRDGQTDYPADYFCTDPGDDDERDPVPTPTPTPTPTPRPSPTITPGTLSYQCLYNPYRIKLNWTSGINANSNSVQKRDVSPTWYWLFNQYSTDMSVRTYTDSNVVPGTSYTYRVKYAPDFPSNMVTPDCNPPQVNHPTVDLTASPSSIAYGGNSVLSWTSTNANYCSATWTSSTATASSKTVYPQNTTTYNITCYGDAGTTPATDLVTVTVGNQVQLPTVTISAENTNVIYGGNTTIRWYPSSNATECSATGGSNGWSGSKSPVTGSFYTSALTNTTTYYINCSNSVGTSANVSVTVYVNNQQQTCTDQNATNYGQPGQCVYNNQQPTVNIDADDSSIDSDESTTVRWTSNNATYCTANGGRNGWSGSKGPSGNFYTGSLISDVTYNITCYNNNGASAFDSTTVNVDDNNNNNDAPDVTTRSASGVDSNSATLNGRVDGNGTSTRAWFEYGTSRNMTEETRDRSYGSGSRAYEEDITGLRANTTYYFRAVAENTEDLVYGSTLSFYTGDNYIYEPPIYQPPVVQLPTVVLSADSTNLAYNGATNIRWYTTNATSCYASGGSFGWAGTKNIGPSSSYTGSLTSSKTYTLTCNNSAGSAGDSVTVSVRGQVLGTTTVRPLPTSLVLINSTVDRNQPIVPTLDNTRPHPGDEINYTVSYQNVGTGSISSLSLRIDLPYEVDYMFSTPNNPTRLGQTLVFNLGTLKANGEGSVSVRVRVKDNVPGGTILNFPAVLSYVDPSGYPQSVSSNVFAEVWSEPIVINQNIIEDKNPNDNNNSLGALILGTGFLPSSVFEWLFLFILILVLIILAKHVFGGSSSTVKIEQH